jgi:hypothetical protein
VIFDIFEYIIMEWTLPNESRICRRVLEEKKKRVAGQLPQSSIGQKRIAGLKTKQRRLRGRQVLFGTFC